MKLSKLHHIAIICSNYQKSKDFYVNVLGLEIIKETYRKERDSYKMDLKLEDGIQIELFSFSNPPRRLSYPEAAGLRHLAFQVENVDLVAKELTAARIEVEAVRIDDITGMAFTFFQDPDGLPIEIYGTVNV